MAVLLAATLRLLLVSAELTALWDTALTEGSKRTLKRGAALQMAVCSLLGCSTCVPSFRGGGAPPAPATSVISGALLVMASTVPSVHRLTVCLLHKVLKCGCQRSRLAAATHVGVSHRRCCQQHLQQQARVWAWGRLAGAAS